MNNQIKNEELYYKHKEELKNRFEYSDIVRGEYIRPYNVELLNEENNTFNNEEVTDLYFSVTDPFYGILYKQFIRKNNKGKIISYECSCDNFQMHSSCTHLVGVIRWYSYLIFLEKLSIEETSNNILDKFLVANKPVLKEEVFLELEIEKIESNNNYYYRNYNEYKVKVKIGKNKMYLFNSKQNSFLTSKANGDKEFSFGKDFVFNYEKNFFNKEANKIFNFINTYHKDLNKRNFYESEIIALLDLVFELNYPFKYNNIVVDKIYETFPFKTEIKSLNKDNYEVDFDMNNYEEICNNYYLSNNNIYRVNNKEKMLINELTNNKINKLVIPKTKIKDFSFGILPIIKKQIEIDNDIKNEIVIIEEPDTSLYFDLNKNNVVCKIKLKYNEEIDYFDNNSNVIRDINYENKIISDLQSYGFIVDKNRIILSDLNKIVKFIDTGLNELASKYNVYSTENFKKLNIKKYNSISSTFSIGKDNILKYDFNLDGITSDEIVNIFKSIKEKKKYYKLKNNDIISLDDEKLNELMDLTDELDFTDEEIINGKGSILKYRAIYLDSVKDTKYSIIKTDNLFSSFIDNFYKYKDADVSLSKEDLSVLRDYQVTGVKWLYNLDKCSFGGILADEMGLGKTIQLIYYIKEMLKENSTYKFLIVVPTSLLYNWEYEFNKFAPEIPVKVVNGMKTKRQDLIKNSNKTVFITTYGLMREDIDYYEQINYHAVILDEAQNIKNPHAGITKSSKRLKSFVKFALTGTPLENSATELWSIFDFIMPGYLSKFDKFSSKYKVHEFDDKTNELLDNLRKQISPFILRRKKNDVIKELPPKIENNIFIDLSDEQKKIYVAELDKVKSSIDEAMKDGGMSKVRFMILPLLTKLRQICIDPRIVYTDYDGGSNKIERFLSIVEELVNNNHKILVFTSFRTALNIVKVELESIGIKCYTMDGSVSSKERMERVNSFNNSDDVKVFLIMLKSGGTGLNLASSDIVIHLDLWWNPQAENQATDRAHRIGQTNTVEVIRLVSKGTIEEKVLDLQEKKKELSEKLIDAESLDQNLIGELTEKDIKELLAYENK